MRKCRFSRRPSTTTNKAQHLLKMPQNRQRFGIAKLELIRYVSGEFAKAAKSLPGGKEGFFQYADKPLNQDLLDRAVANHGAAVHAGEKVQITKLEFHDHTIVVDVNGGGRVKKRFLDHIQISANGSAPTMRSTTEAQEAGPSGMQPGAGSTLYLEFGKAIPDLSPEELRQVLSPFLDFSRQRSASGCGLILCRRTLEKPFRNAPPVLEWIAKW